MESSGDTFLALMREARHTYASATVLIPCQINILVNWKRRWCALPQKNASTAQLTWIITRIKQLLKTAQPARPLVAGPTKLMPAPSLLSLLWGEMTAVWARAIWWIFQVEWSWPPLLSLLWANGVAVHLIQSCLLILGPLLSLSLLFMHIYIGRT